MSDGLIERWIDAKDHPGYEVSNTGYVRNKKSGRILKGSLNKHGGYLRVGIDGKHYYIHRLVADSFYDGDMDHKYMDVNHIDGDKLNNELPNLEWMTRKENIDHAFIHGLKYPTVVKVVRCRFCRHRHEFASCESKPDWFYCADGERED